jgi:putative two-component system response regulator
MADIQRSSSLIDAASDEAFLEPVDSFLEEIDSLGPIETFDPLESIDELELIGEEGELQAANPGLLGVAKQFLQTQLSSTPIFQNSAFPVLALNDELQITYANIYCRSLFPDVQKLVGCSFIDIFGKSFQIEDVRNIREAIVKGNNNSTWKGLAQVKSHDKPTVMVRVYIFPGIITPRQKPAEFVVMFDDVTEENKRIFRSVFESLLEASKLKDNDTGKHITRVNYYSRALAEALRNQRGYDTVDADFVDDIGFLASMHDVGKIGTPDDILHKEGALSDFEWAVMKEHTTNGAFILSSYPNPMARDIAQNHHEKWNGKGYPLQIEGEMIPLAARIVSIADVYDALRMKRSYKPPFSHELTLEKMIETRGTQFDPALFDIFLTISDEFDVLYSANQD